MSCFIAYVLTSLTCWSARLATSDLNLLCLHSKYNVISVVIAKIIAAVSMNMSTIRLLVKKLLLGCSISISCLSYKSKISFFCLYCEIYSFSIWRADDRVSSNLVSLRNISRVCSDGVLLVSIRNVNLKINGCCVYGWMNIGNWMIKFLFLPLTKVTNFIL